MNLLILAIDARKVDRTFRPARLLTLASSLRVVEGLGNWHFRQGLAAKAPVVHDSEIQVIGGK